MLNNEIFDNGSYETKIYLDVGDASCLQDIICQHWCGRHLYLSMSQLSKKTEFLYAL